MAKYEQFFPSWLPTLAIVGVAWFLYDKYKNVESGVVDLITGTDSQSRASEINNNSSNTKTLQQNFDSIKNESWSPAPLHNQSTHISKASSLYDAMNTWNPSWIDLGTKYGRVMDILKNCNAADLRRIYAYFGLKTSQVFSYGTFTGDLIQWFESEFDGNDKANIKQLWKNTRLW